MTVLSFTITFYSPFRVGAASARDGITATIDHNDPLPADHFVFGPRATAVDLDRTRLDPALQPRAGILRERASEGLVEPQPLEIFWQSQRMSTELHDRCVGRKWRLGIRYTPPNYTARCQR